jgi:hypothetical protein
MSKLQMVCTLGMLAFALSGAWAQDSSAPPASEPVQQAGQQEPAPAQAQGNQGQENQAQENQGQENGQENAPPPSMSENPPLSGLDLPALGPHAAPLSYLQPGATISESADTNAGNTLGNQDVASITRGLVSASLRRLWSHYDLALDYVGGACYYSDGQGLKSIQQGDFEQKMLWKRGQFAVRDSFSYLPEGNFGSSYGSLGSQGISSLGSTAFGAFFGGTALGALGTTPRITNVSLADVSEYLSPKSAITAAGGYGLTHFNGSDVTETGGAFLGSSQTSGQVGYSRVLTPHTQVAAVYGYQAFDFTVFGTAFHSQVIMLMYGHRISGRMDLLVGAGPQFTRINTACTIIDLLEGVPTCSQNSSGETVGSVPTTRIGVAGQARLRYQFTHTSMLLSFERFETSGSGLFAGAESNIARLTASRPLTRVWSGFTDIGFAQNSRLQNLTQVELGACNSFGQHNPLLSPCPGVNANTYTYGFVGVGLHRPFGRSLHGYVSYEFTELDFDHSYCGGLPACSRISNRDVVTFGLDWTPRPIRLD